MLERFLSHKRFESIHLLVTYLLKKSCAIPLLNFWITLWGSSSLVTHFNSGKGIHSNNYTKTISVGKKNKQRKKNNNNSTSSSSSSSNNNNNDIDNDNDDDVDNDNDNYNDAAIMESLFTGNSKNYEKGDG